MTSELVLKNFPDLSHTTHRRPSLETNIERGRSFAAEAQARKISTPSSFIHPSPGGT